MWDLEHNSHVYCIEWRFSVMERVCKRCKRGIREGDTICRYCHEPYVPSAYEAHSGSVYVSRKCMGDISKLALMYSIIFFCILDNI